LPYRVEEVDPAQTALIVVDMENDFVAEGAPMEIPAGRAMVPRLRRLIDECRSRGMLVVFTAHVHRRDGSDMGLFDDTYQAIAERRGLIEGEPGTEIYSELGRQPDDIVLKKHRYSAFHATDLDMVLRGRRIETVVVTGVSTENCCHATARDAMFHDYKVIFLVDCNATHDYPDLGWGGMTAEEVHRSVLCVLAFSTADVMTSDDLLSRIKAPAEAVSETVESVA
jgi:nicotinamidase-related amidase